ncbi:MAG: hypothetical protein HY695_11130 [Deltaproteobacteria bacterium]|nr:hypothetical protein [Deltaproteobacteria bacterium]
MVSKTISSTWGGHSLLGAKLISRLGEVFRIELPLRSLFESPTIAGLAEQVEEALRKENGLRTLPIIPASRAGNLPLSFSQQRLWFLDQLDPGNPNYNLLVAFQLRGPLNLTALVQSFNEIIRRHDALRTVFRAPDGEPVQIIVPSVTLEPRVLDLREIVSDAAREAEIRHLSTIEAQRRFDLTRGPLLRITLIRITEDEHVLLRTIHHIVFDVWSMGILVQELSALYKSFSSGEPALLPKLHIQYADFARWQRERCQDELLLPQLSYWKRVLRDIPPVLELPTDRPRTAVQTVRGARQYFAVSESLSAGLKSLGNRHKVTLFMVLLAAFQTLLHRYTGQTDIVVGSPVAGRNHSELEGLIGFFLNMLVLRTDMSGNCTFRGLLVRIREVCLEAYAHQDLPFEKLVEELRPDRDLRHNPLFQVAFSLQNTPTFPLELAGLTVDELEVDIGIARFDIELIMMEGENGLRGYVNYKTDLFNAGTIDRPGQCRQSGLRDLHLRLDRQAQGGFGRAP